MVQLTGYQGPRGFRAEQVYDASRQMQQAAQQDAQIREESLNSYQQLIQRVGQRLDRNQQANLEALSGFSSTLSESLVGIQKERNEREYNLGLSEVLNGNAELPGSVLDDHRTQTEILRQSADADTQTANQLENEGQLGVATELRKQSRAISGWRAYGQAVGATKLAATKAQAFFTEFMDRTDPIIPLPDGRLIAPSMAESPSEIQAVMAVAQQEFVQTNNLQTINPVVLVENLSQSLQAIKGQISANHMAEQTRKRRETALSDTDSQVNLSFSDPQASAEDMSANFQNLVQLYVTEGNLSKGAASDRAVEMALESIKSLPKEIAEDLLLKFAEIPKIAGEPQSIKVGSAYARLFNQAADAIEDRSIALEQREERKQDKQAEQAANLLEKARQDVNQGPEALRALREQTIQTLGILADKGSSRALQLRGDLLAEPANVDYTLYRQYREGINQGQRPSKEQLQRDFIAGKLTQNMVQELGAYSTESDYSEFKSTKSKSIGIKEIVLSDLRKEKAVTLNPFNEPLQHAGQVNRMIADLEDIAYRIYDAERQKGNLLDDGALTQLVINQLPIVRGRYFSKDPQTNEWKVKPISNNPAVTPDRIRSTLRGYVPDVGGFDPRTIQLRNLRSGNSALPKTEVEENIQRLQSGQAPTARMQALAATNPQGIIGALTHQAQHHGLDAAAIQNSPQAQRLMEAQRLAPRAAQRLATTTDYMGQLLQIRRIAEAQARRQRQQQTSSSPNGLPPGAQVGVMDYIRLGLQQGLDPEKAITMAAVGMAESSGQSAVINNNPQTGDLSYGLWQINMIDDLGPARLRQYGLRSADDLKDPETNARVMANILRGSGIRAWGAYNDKRYLQYMGEARRAYAELKRSGGL